MSRCFSPQRGEYRRSRGGGRTPSVSACGAATSPNVASLLGEETVASLLREGLLLLGILLALILSACSGDDSKATTSSSASTTTAAGVENTSETEEMQDSDLVAIIATELENGLVDPLPMDRRTAGCTAETVVGEMGVAEGQSLDEYLGSRNEEEVADVVLGAYFECSEPSQVGNALADDLITTVGFPADDDIRSCLSSRLDSADEVRGLVGLTDEPAGPLDVLEGCVGLGDVMNVDMSDLTQRQRNCLNENGDDVLTAMMTPSESDTEETRRALRTVLEDCGLDPSRTTESLDSDS